ncbi:MAG: hypothetical protein ACOCQ4_02535 [bacterium]
MKTKTTLILTISFFLTFMKSYAQVEDEIKTFVDSTEIIVTQGRKMMAHKINEKKYEKVLEVYDYLNEKAAESDCYPFTYVENIYLFAVTAQWDRWIEMAENYEEYNKPLCSQIDDRIIRYLFDDLQENDSLLKEDLENSSLKREDKDIISLFLFISENGADNMEYAKKLKEFRKSYPQTRFQTFLNKFMPDKPINASLGFSLGASQVSLTSNLAENFEPKTLVNFAMDFDVNRFHSSLTFSIGSLELQSPFSASLDGVQYDFEMNEDFHFLDAGVDLGFFIVKSKHINIAPYMHLGTTVLESKLFNDDYNEEELKLINKFTYGAGVSAEVKLFKFSHSNYNYYIQRTVDSESFIGLKIEGGYNKVNGAEYNAYEGNYAYARFSLIYGLSYL